MLWIPSSIRDIGRPIQNLHAIGLIIRCNILRKGLVLLAFSLSLSAVLHQTNRPMLPFEHRLYATVIDIGLRAFQGGVGGTTL